MNNNSKRFAHYWRNVLADAELGKGSFKSSLPKEVGELTNTLQYGEIESQVVQQLFKGKSLSIEEMDVLIRPYVLSSIEVQHGKWNGSYPLYITPIIIHAALERKSGKIYPQRVTIPRDVLSPQDKASYTIGEIDSFDNSRIGKPLV